MDFWSYQDEAKRSSRKLIVLFVLAAIATILSTYIAVVLIFVPPKSFEGSIGLYFVKLLTSADFSRRTETGMLDWILNRDWWQPALFFAVAGITAAIVAGGSAFKINQLRQGGRSLASMLGGRHVPSYTTDQDERRLLNVVEEMAIASGTRVPAVYLMEAEPGINAFAAGLSREDMVIGVTQGSLRLLSRDELQGVIAHEFSHILRGDMRLNMRLLGTVSGITLISMLGYFLLRFSTTGVRVNFSGSRSEGRGGGGLGTGILALGAVLFALGYVGVFFSKLIKSAIARQREFLADASAVQFTRNLSGLAGALKKIGGLSYGSRMRSPHAPEASHFFFSNGLKRNFLQILATHPPLGERILRLDPSFTGEYPKIESPPDLVPDEKKAISGISNEKPPTITSRMGGINPEVLISNIGALVPERVDYAANLRDSLHPDIAEAAKEPVGASAIILSLLLSSQVEVRTLQMQKLRQDAAPAVFDEIKKLISSIETLGTGVKIPLVDLAVEALRNLSDRQYEQFRTLTEAMISSDERVDLFEFSLKRILHRHLDAHFFGTTSLKPKYFRTMEVLPEVVLLLSALAWTGEKCEAGALTAFRSGARQLDLSERRDLNLQPQSESRNLKMVDAALEQLSRSGHYVKKNFLFSCAHVVASDGKVLEAEHELLRAIADSLELPIPPLVQQLMH